MLERKRNIILGTQLEASALTPLRVLGGSGTRTRYRCLCNECSLECVKCLRDLLNPALAKACPKCVKARVVQRSSKHLFNHPGSPEFFSRRPKTYASDKKSPP